jgi:hypothetical protein
MEIKYIGDLKKSERTSIEKNLNEFIKLFDPVEKEIILIFADNCTGAPYFESHVQAEKLLNNSTIDVPLDPDNQGEYRANRDIVDDHAAFVQMKDDAGKKRSFSNIVAEYSMEYDKKHPLKIIGGQHRYLAIKEAREKGINEYHGIKTFFCLDKTQRLDVQLISNTNIAVSGDLLDRMNETVSGPELRNWCQEVGLLEEKQDFADKKERGGNITVRGARSFILSYFESRKYDSINFDKIKPEPILATTGGIDEQWRKFRSETPDLWKDKGLKEAGKELAELNVAQYNSITQKTGSLEFAEKALSYPIITSWAYVAGLLYGNKKRLLRHYSLKTKTSSDPLNTGALSKGRHKTDAENYRGLGVRTDLKDRGRLVELFFLQAEQGSGITPALVDVAIKKYHAKLAQLDVEEAQRKI